MLLYWNCHVVFKVTGPFCITTRRPEGIPSSPALTPVLKRGAIRIGVWRFDCLVLVVVLSLFCLGFVELLEFIVYVSL